MDQVSASHIGAGYELVQSDVSASPSEGASESTLANCWTSGTTATGTSGIPLEIDGRASGLDRCEDVVVTGCLFRGGLRCTIDNHTYDSHVSGCIFDGQSGSALQAQGQYVVVEGCTFRDATTGVEIQAAANDFHVVGCTFDNCTSDVTDAGSTTVVDRNVGQSDHQHTKKTDGDVSMPSTLTDVGGLTGLALPGLGGNSQRVFSVYFSGTIQAIQTHTTGTTLWSSVVAMYVGPNGDKTDTLVGSAPIVRQSSSSNHTEWNSVVIGPFAIVMSAGDKVGIAVQTSAVGGTDPTIESYLLASTSYPATVVIEKVREK
jgi:hypothetical protein